MYDLIDIPAKCRLNKEIRLDKIFHDDTLNKVKKVIWTGSLKPGIADVIPSNDGIKRFEEIQFMHMVINDVNFMYPALRELYKAIAYPCIVCVQINNKYLISACRMNVGKRNSDENIIKYIYCSHWMHKDLISNKARNFLMNINRIVHEQNDLRTLYTTLSAEVQFFRLSGENKTHVKTIVKKLGGASEGFNRYLERVCIPYKYYGKIDFTQDRKRIKSSPSYSITYDTEDLWYCFMNDVKLCNAIKSLGIEDIDHLISYLDNVENFKYI